MQARVREGRAGLAGLDGRVRPGAYEAVLARGYALVLDARQYGLVKRNHFILARQLRTYLGSPVQRGELGEMR